MAQLPEYKMISDQQGKDCQFGRYPVTVIPHFKVRMRDGVSLSIKVWFPSNNISETCFADCGQFLIYEPANSAPFIPQQPVILEYIPYRKSDGTLERDHSRHTWFASHGYVIVRADMRGSGESEGLYYGEYLVQEQEDACDLIAWLAAQHWTNGKVGMYGKSWGGFNGLQVAYEQPPALKAIITLYSTDDRYATDVHYIGGCIMANQALWWSSFMTISNSGPPHPGLVPDWRDLWRQRLEHASEPWAHDWFSHQTRDAFWRHASVCEDPTRVTCPVLAIGGWNDGYHDAVFRFAQTMPTARGILGPWSHNWPDQSKPGPTIAYNDECLRWWDYHLKGVENGVSETPLLRLFMQDGFEPHYDVDVDRLGSWVVEDEWPPNDPSRVITMIPDNSSLKLLDTSTGITIPTADKTMKFEDFAGHGQSCGEWWFVGTNSLPGDQRIEDLQSLCWTSDPLVKPLSILGFPALELTVTSENSDTGLVAVRLCDVTDDGRSTLITFGVLNLTHRNGHAADQLEPLEIGKPYHVTVTCASVSYIVRSGHRLRVCVAPSYWPLCWPPNKAVDLTISTGPQGGPTSEGEEDLFKSRLILPVYPSRETQRTVHKCPELRPARSEAVVLPQVILTPGSYRRQYERDLSSDRTAFIVSEDSGRKRLSQTGGIQATKFTARYQMCGVDPLSARIDIDYEQEHEWPELEVKTTVVTVSQLWADSDHFHLHHEMDVKLNGQPFFDRKWDKEIKRFLV